MSTRAVIGRVDRDVFVGRYHHSSGYPRGLGKTLYDLYHGFFQRDIKRMLAVLIDQHPAGWSNIVDADFGRRPGFLDGSFHPENPRPQCYCHGKRHDPETLIVSTDMEEHWWDIEWGYAIDENSRNMTIHCYHHGDRIIDVVNLDGPEPDWNALNEAGWEQ